MRNPSEESQIVLAVQAIKQDSSLTYGRASAIFNVPKTTLYDRMNGKRARQDTRSASCRLTELEEGTIVRYILDLDARGFSPRLRDVEDMANVVLEARDASRVGMR